MSSSIAYVADNIFAKIIAGKIPSYKIFETEHALAILDAFPSVPGHALLLPKASGYATVMDLPKEVASQVYAELPRLARAVQAVTKCDGINILQNNGKAAGQVVFHAHIHVIPRFERDTMMNFGGGGSTMIEPKEALEMVKKLQDALA